MKPDWNRIETSLNRVLATYAGKGLYPYRIVASRAWIGALPTQMWFGGRLVPFEIPNAWQEWPEDQIVVEFKAGKGTYGVVLRFYDNEAATPR